MHWPADRPRTTAGLASAWLGITSDKPTAYQKAKNSGRTFQKQDPPVDFQTVFLLRAFAWNGGITQNLRPSKKLLYL